MPEDLSIAALTAAIDVPDEIRNFAHIPGGEVVFGRGALSQVGEKAKSLGATRVLLVTDPGIRQAGHEDRCLKHLREVGLEVFVFDKVHENPTTRDVDDCVAAAKGHEIDLIVGLGGGSSMDTAKGCNFVLTNGGKMQDYWGVGKATKPMLPLIVIPTTAGTGSECQSFALIADAETHMKMACGDKKAAAAVSILDPELTVTMPFSVTAVTGIDAIAHAIETAVSNNRTDISSAYSRLAFGLLDDGFERVLSDPSDLKARAQMQLGAAYAGTAIENSMLGAAHSTANPLSAHHQVIHGQAVGLMLPHVIRYNRRKPEIAAIYETLHPDLDQRVEHFLERSQMARHAGFFNVMGHEVPKLAREAAQQWTAQFNPVPVGEDAMAEIYRAAL